MKYKMKALKNSGSKFQANIFKTDIALNEDIPVCKNCGRREPFCNICFRDLKYEGICVRHITGHEHFCGLACLTGYILDMFDIVRLTKEGD